MLSKEHKRRNKLCAVKCLLHILLSIFSLFIFFIVRYPYIHSPCSAEGEALTYHKNEKGNRKK